MRCNFIKSLCRKTAYTIITKNNEYYLLGDIKPNHEAWTMPQNNKKPIMWQVVLKKEPDQNYFNGEYKRVNITKKDGIDKGHFIPDCFMKYLLPGYLERTEFSNKDNKYNISEQSKNANRGFKDIVGQLQYEQKILHHFKEKTSDVYFEIEELYDDLNSVLGRRVYIHFVDPEKEDLHVFIPEEF